MAKSARASSRKVNNQRLKTNVFGPVESARAERLSAKLMELANQPKPQRDTEMKADDLESNAGEDTAKETAESTEMDVDSAANKAEVRRTSKKLLMLKKRRKSNIVFPKYGDRKIKGRK
ncbi:unnamed protein product [Parascedosporium putredinis]|uniref:DUF2423 domain-containing protein n=1 Tax=Parascedosporium putredinis TaxID=1442378 RepID=A0A9P1GW98_9PEZI|nr:unnamed protein product [Parascedosporium putredinis]CAI7988564.1 unnamed protein product [Parascedosporium putredinis]